MIDPLNNLAGSRIEPQPARPAIQGAAAAKVQDEFLTIFYKELLKQTFKAPDLNPLGEDQDSDNNFISAFRSDLMVEQLAQELVKSGQLRPDWFPGENK